MVSWAHLAECLSPSLSTFFPLYWSSIPRLATLSELLLLDFTLGALKPVAVDARALICSDVVATACSQRHYLIHFGAREFVFPELRE